MRRFIKNKLDEMVMTLSEAQEQIIGLLKAKEQKSLSVLLQQSQECAISMGNMIEETEGEGAASVKKLEEYCEALFQASLCTSGEKKDIQRIRKQLRQTLISVENSIKNDIHVTTETVFLPYKAAMWDSLESVWQDLREQEDNTSYVIPIPYYEKNPDGTFGKEHYEKDLYPEDVPVTDYQGYDFEKRAGLFGVAENSFCDSRYNDPAKWLSDVTDGGAEVYFECVGNNESIYYGIEGLAPAGRLVLVGNPASDMSFSRDTYWKILRKCLTISGIWNSSFAQVDPGEDGCRDDWHFVLDLIAEGGISPEKLISHRFPLEDSDEALKVMRDRKSDRCKVMILTDS